MAAKLSDREFAERARASAARRAERVRLRRLAAGKVAVTQWIPVTAKQRLDALATAFSQTPADVLTTAIMALPMPAAAPTLQDELHAVAKELTATPEPAMEEWTTQASDAAADIDAFTADPNSDRAGGAPRLEQHSRPATLRERDRLPRFELDAHPERERHLPVETVLSRSSMMQAIVAMLDAEPGLTGAEIARRLGQQGYRASNGAALNGANVLRDYQRWTAVEGENE